MRLHRFFVDPAGGKLLPGAKVKIEDDVLAHQWKHVLRFQVGQEVILLDNTGFEFHATLVSIGNRTIEVEILSSHRTNFTPALPVFLFLALAKREAFETAIEKGTELGVTGFIPVITERSEKKKLNLDRSRLIIKEACEQSGRATLSEIFEPISFSKALETIIAAGSSGNSIALHPVGEFFSAEKYKTSISDVSTGERVNIFIGPEGGFTEKEIEMFKEKNIPVVSLGDQVLRFETAVIAISSLLLLKS